MNHRENQKFNKGISNHAKKCTETKFYSDS